MQYIMIQYLNRLTALLIMCYDDVLKISLTLFCLLMFIEAFVATIAAKQLFLS